MIQVEGLAKSFRVHEKEPGLKGSLQSLFKRKWIVKHALKAVTFKVGPGEIVGVVGANGAGKTTLIKVLSGIIHPTSGKAKVLGYTPWERETGFRKQIALIMGQKAQLWWDLPAADCFLLLREIYQIPPARFAETLGYLTRTLDVGDQLKTQIRRLSLGERMKMELIAALLHQPRVVYLDEPTIGLDLTAQVAIREFLLRYREQHQPAMLLTSHYMEDIERLCQRILVIQDGQLVYDGPLERITRDHAQFKVITVRLTDERAFSLPAELGQVQERVGDLLKVRALRGKVPDAAAYLLQNLAVADLTIEEQDISSVIEGILSRKSAVPAAMEPGSKGSSSP